MAEKLNIKEFNASYHKLALKFHSGNNYLDQFLKTQQSLDCGIGKTYIWLNNCENEIVGYYNIGVGTLNWREKESKMGGAAHINCFALDEKYHHKELEEQNCDDGVVLYFSDMLFLDCLNRIQYIRERHIGYAFITLNSTEAGLSLYMRYDFEELEMDMHLPIEDETDKDCTQMYLPLDLEE